MNKLAKYLGIILAIIVLIVLLNGLFVVKEGERALVLVLGDLKKNSNQTVKIYTPGLYFKLPFISTVKNFNARIQGFDSGVFSALTAQQTFLEVSYYVKWRITDVGLYYKRTGGSALKAVSLMEPKINDIVRAQFGKRTSDAIISTDRANIMQSVLHESKAAMEQQYGINIIDVRLEVVKLPDRVLKSVFTRMASERKQFANYKRAEGMKEAEAIQATADKQVIVIKATANKQAAEIKAQGEAQAATIYADAYNSDQDFYAFYRSLLAYKHAFKQNGQNFLVLSPDSEFFNYFNTQQFTGQLGSNKNKNKN